jgi:hypothetical protein
MENVKYLSSKKTDEVIRSLGHTLYTTELYFKINHNIAQLIRERTNAPPIYLEVNFNMDDIYTFRIATDENFESIRESVINTIEEVANDGDEWRFYYHVLSNCGRDKVPMEFHNQMEKEYEIKDMNIEWWVAHFFIGLSGLIFDSEDFYDL